MNHEFFLLESELDYRRARMTTSPRIARPRVRREHRRRLLRHDSAT